jgi:kynurenine formamidase
MSYPSFQGLQRLASPFRALNPLLIVACGACSIAGCDRVEPPGAGQGGSATSTAAMHSPASTTAVAVMETTSNVAAAKGRPVARTTASPVIDFGRGRWVDLTHTFETDMPHFPADGPLFKSVSVQRGKWNGNPYLAMNKLEMAEHLGTHIDAPNHLKEGGLPVDRIPIESLMGIAVIIDLADLCRDPQHVISVADIEAWERKAAEVIDGRIVILKTGYSRHWGDNEKYFGTKRQDAGGAALVRFPALSPETAAWLVTARNIKAIGTDTTSIDPPLLLGVHQIFSEHAVPVFENVGSLDKLGSATHVFLAALPIKVKDGTGGPTRIVAFVSP